MYGEELILDLYGCNVKKFTREVIALFMENLCFEIDMTPATLHFWDFEDEPEEYEKAPNHLAGITAVQFIETSNIIIHTLDKLEECYVNIFSCKPFDQCKAKRFVEKFFDAEQCIPTTITRGMFSRSNNDTPDLHYGRTHSIPACMLCKSWGKCSGNGVCGRFQWDKRCEWPKEKPNAPQNDKQK